jgi:TonB-linked SusC/RagA family outer membrane protein
MRNIQKIVFLGILLLGSALSVYAQSPKFRDVEGTVKDESGEPLIGVTIYVKNQLGLGTSSDIDGKFKLKVGLYDILVVQYLGYSTVEVPVAENKFDVVLQEETKALNEVVVVGAGGISQRKIALSAAMTVVDVKTLKVPTSNVSNALVGNVAGIIGHQTTGEPGENVTEFWVRGISTFGANAKALILVDGIERPLDQLNVEDIESFSVLKDASATAIYGSRGANGVVLVTTKRGAAGKVNINVKVEGGYNTRSRTPEYTDGTTYALMANEAMRTRYQPAVYSDQDIEIIRRGLDPDLFPNVDWQDVILKNGTPNYRGTLSLSGGGTSARYYVSGSYIKEDGMYKTANINQYSTNVSYERFNYRANVDMDLTSTSLLKVGVSGFLINQIKPVVTSDNIWYSLANMTPLTVPRVYSNGSLPSYGRDFYSISPEVVLNNAGYLTNWENKAETNVTLEQNLKFITPGLRFIGTFSFDTEAKTDIYREKMPELWYAGLARSAEGELVMNRRMESRLMTQYSEAESKRRYYTEAKLDYATVIGDAHRISALLMYYQQEKTLNLNIVNDPRSAIPFRNLGLSGRVTYGFRDRYLIEYNFGYTGSENFEKNERFGFFPAISGAWVLSEEPLLKDNLHWLDMFKIRYSYGEVGNDKLTDDEKKYEKRFPYLSFVSGSANYTWGEYGSNTVAGYRITTMGSPGLTWETAQKHNLGVDFVLFNNKISITSDIFRDHRTNIFVTRNLMPYSTGLQDLTPEANLGEMESRGIEGVGSYTDKIGNVTFTLRGNFTLAKTNVINWDEADNALYYQMKKGYRHDQTRGLIALGLFADQEDIDNSPRQTFGDYLPGDIKYKDVNGDGLIDMKDEVPMGYTTVPNLVYGMGLSLSWKNFDFNVLLQGSGQTDFFVGGSSVYPFTWTYIGNILDAVTDPNDRWISREISGNPATENPNAILPRLSYGSGSGSDNNFRQSSFWLRDASYLRLKNLEFGYSFPKRYAKAIYAENIRIGFIGYNLLVFSPFKWWDPEVGKRNDSDYYKDGAKYPISKNYTFNLTVNF